MATRTPLNDARRLAALEELEIVDTAPESDYDDLASLAAAVCRSRVAALNFVDEDRHFTKAIVGMPTAESGSVSNELSLCAATVLTDDGVMIVPTRAPTSASARTRSSPAVPRSASMPACRS